MIIYTKREGYGLGQDYNTLTVGELIEFLQDFDENEKIHLAFNDGYAYGGIRYDMFEADMEDEEEDDYYE